MFTQSQDGSLAPPTLPTSEPGVPIGTDVSTQTTSFTPQTSSYSPLHFPSQGSTQGSGATQGTHTHLFSHLPLHSQQARVPYLMIPIGGIQMVQARPRSHPTIPTSASSTPMEGLLLGQTRRETPWCRTPITQGLRTLGDHWSDSQEVVGASQSGPV